MEKICSIYVIRNCFNNKVYVGQTWETISERFRKHNVGKSCCRKLRNAFNKYGYENFHVELIALGYNQEDADSLEEFFITNFNSIENGYNIKSGGSRGRQSEETKILIGKANSIALLGHKISEETKKKLSLALKGLNKPTRSDNHILNLRKSRRKNSKLNIDIISNIRKDYDTKLYSNIQLSIKYNINKRTISDIVNYKIWK